MGLAVGAHGWPPIYRGLGRGFAHRWMAIWGFSSGFTEVWGWRNLDFWFGGVGARAHGLRSEDGLKGDDWWRRDEASYCVDTLGG